MKKSKIVFAVLLIVLFALVTFLVLSNTVFKDAFFEKEKPKDNEINSVEDKKELIEDITSDINDEPDSSVVESNKKKKEDDKKYDQYLVASGYSGASNNVYYIKDGVLYHLVLSTNKITKIAEGVTKIESGKGTILVYKGNKFKIINEDNYLTYVD